MPASDPMHILLSHDKWATQEILNACDGLNVEQFHRRFDIGQGSLHDTLTHMLLVVGRWGDLLAGRPLRSPVDGAVFTVDQLRSQAQTVYPEFALLAKSHPLDGQVAREREGKTYTFTRGAVITHATTHGMHHRAQCLNMLRHLGVNPLPKSSVMEWTMLGE
jgi:uncharacterized damage-inducible protein DinB